MAEPRPSQTGEADPLLAIVNDARYLIDQAHPEVVPEHHWKTGWEDLSEYTRNAIAADHCKLAVVGSPLPRLAELAASPLDTAQAVLDAVDVYHDTLPLTRTERLWLAEKFRQTDTPDLPRNAIGGDLRQICDIITSVGRRTVVTGDALFARMWDWQREEADYRLGISAVRASRLALREIVAAYDLRHS